MYAHYQFFLQLDSIKNDDKNRESDFKFSNFDAVENKINLNSYTFRIHLV